MDLRDGRAPGRGAPARGAAAREPHLTGRPVLERERELRRLAGAVARAADREGALVLVEGPAGIGKTALLRAAREEASAAGFTVLGATAAELDRGFPFGVVHQLLGPVVAGASDERRARLLAGAAAAAEVVLSPAGVEGGAGAGAGGSDDPGYAVLHGLYWLLANLAEEEPVALLVDDLHWADRASLRLLEYLGRRLEGLPLLVVGTTRAQEPGAEQGLLADLAAGPSAEVLRPSPLSVEAAATVIEAALGRPPDPAFVDACIAATGGTPLLVRAIADRAAEEGLRGAASESARVTALGAAGLGRMMHRRLASLGPDALALARAGAVLGERRRLDDLAAVAGLDAGAAAAAADALAGAGLLDSASWAFVHPVVRAAVADGTPPGERTVLHARAARRLRAAGVRADEVAVHLLAAEPAGDPQVVAILREAARSAVAGGAPEAAVAHLRRALAEPPAPADRAALLLELGELEVAAGDGAAIGHLTEALDAGLTGNAAARARGARAFLSVMGDPTPLVDELERALADAEDPALRLRLESNLLDASIYHARSVPQRAELLRGAEGSAPSVVLLAHQAVEASYIPAPAAETIALAQRAAVGGELVRAVGPDNSTFNLLTHAFRYAERADLGRALLEEGEAAIQRTGLRFGRLFLEHAWGYWHLDFGRLGAGLAEAQSGLDRLRAAQLDVTAAALIAIVAELLVELDRADEAAPLVDAVVPEVEETVGGPFAVAARGAVRWQQHRLEEAEADFRRAIALLDARGWRSPLVTGARLKLAQLLGSGDEAEALARDALDTARAAGLRAAEGASLRVLGRVTHDADALRAAVAALDGSPFRLERGWALHDLGAHLRREGRRADAREPLRAAVAEAERHEATLLGRLAREELTAAGGRPSRAALSGPASLTPSERRVAELAAKGLSNREIAETLWVTRKTVEVHLGSAYGKLGIKSRAQLPDALGPLSQAA